MSNDDLRVSVEFGMTFEHDGAFFKPLITVSNIDPKSDVDAQVTIGLEAAATAFVRIDEQLDVSLSQLLATNGKPGALERLEKLDKGFTECRTKLNDIIASLKAAGIKNTAKE